ncbi:MAG TPA: lytic transglycosylase domain-containing protein [Bacilli bacterium]
MRIDPRLAQQLLKLQISDGMFPKAQTDLPGSPDTTFLELFAALMEQTDPASADSVNSVGSRFPLPFDMPANWRGADPSGYDALISDASAAYGVDKSLIKAVIQAESSFRADAVSSAGAKGLMQLMDDTAASLGVANPFDPAQNINGGTKFLRDLLNRYNGNTATALAAYNAGPGAIGRLNVHNDAELFAHYGQLPAETQHYVRKVLGIAQTYRDAQNAADIS